MRRTMAALVVAAATLGMVASTAGGAAASGGGGCGGPVSDATGTTVRIHDFCFLPTILRVRRGQAVTFDNRDSFSHVVLGANAVWGSFTQLRGRHTVTYRFTRAGVYPYVCTYHPGMVGAIVVGNASGRGAAHATATAAGPVIAVSPETRAAQPVAADPVTALPIAPSVQRHWYEPWQLVALVVLVVLVLAFARSEVRRHRAVLA
jgi:plastocyanin